MIMIKTSISLQDLRKRIYFKSKQEKSHRFWGLYVHICKMETLREAYIMAKKNNGSPGIDNVSFEEIEETGVEKVKIIPGFKDQYDYDFDTTIKGGVKEKIYKHAVFFLGEVTNQKIEISDEHLDYGWFDFETATKRLFYQNGQDLLKRAHQFLLKEQSFVI